MPAPVFSAPLPLLATKILPRSQALVHRSRAFLPASIKPLTFPQSSLTSTLETNTSPARLFASTANMSHDSTAFKDVVKHRRTIYSLNKKAPIDKKRIEEICRTAIKDVPSSFNSQSTRMVVLLHAEHDKFWDIVRDILKAHVPEGQWEHTGQRIQMFRNAYGSILFYEDPEPVKKLQSSLPQYADRFPQWSEHTSAMHQYMMWCALESEGFGCNLQHYNPLPDQKAAAEWNIPLEWQLKAQLVFGGEEPGSREKLPTKSEEPIEKRLFIHGA